MQVNSLPKNSNTLTFDVIPVNDAPTGTDNTITLAEDGIHSFVPSDFGFSDIDGDAFQSVRIIEFSGSGTLTLGGVDIAADTEINLSELSDLTYTAAPNENGDAVGSLTFQVRDDGGAANGGVDLDSTPNLITFNITPVNDAPVANDDSFATSEDTPVTIALADLLANDSDVDGDTLQVDSALVTDPTNGTVDFNGDGTFTYTPNENFFGTDTFIYGVSDGNGGTTEAIVEITVDAGNDIPVAGDDSFTTLEDSPLTIAASDLLSNDSDSDGDTLQVDSVLVTDPSNGSVTFNDDGTFTYTPNENFFGTDSFVYSVSDGNGGTAEATVNITVDPVNDIPIAVNDQFTTAEDTALTIAVSDLLANDTDLDGDELQFTSIVSDVSNGTVTVNGDGTLTYTPNANFIGTDSFVYSVTDGNGGNSSATVEITISGENDAPTAVADRFTVNEDTSLNNLDLLANDFDADEDVLTFTITSSPSEGGTVTVNADGTVDYLPAADFFGNESFEYQVSDGNGGFSTSTVTIDVISVNDMPTASQDAYTVLSNESGMITQSVLTNDFDVEGTSLTATLISGPSNGTLSLAENGTFTYVADAGFVGLDSFVYLASDGDSTSQASVEINVLPNATIIGTPPTNTGGSMPDDTPNDSNDLMDIDSTDNDNSNDNESNDNSESMDSNSGNEASTNLAAISNAVADRRGADSLNGVSSELEQLSDDGSAFASFEFYVAADNDPDLELTNSLQTTSLNGLGNSDDGTGLQTVQLQSHLQFATSVDMQMMFDSLKDAENADGALQQFEITVGSLATFGTIGFVLWTLRGGALVGLALSQLPTWQMMDPLPILDSYRETEALGGDEKEEAARLFSGSTV